MLVGHNPGIAELAAHLAVHGRDEDRARLRRSFPTGALAVVSIDAADWSGVGSQAGTLLEFTCPGDLPH